MKAESLFYLEMCVKIEKMFIVELHVGYCECLFRKMYIQYRYV